MRSPRPSYLVPRTSPLVPLVVLLLLAACDFGPPPPPPAPATLTAPPTNTAEPTASPPPTATSEQKVLADARMKMRRLPYYQGRVEVLETGGRDLRLDIAFQGPARSAMTLSGPSGVQYARAINGEVWLPGADGRWALAAEPTGTSLIPQPVDLFRNYNPVRAYNATFLRAPYDVRLIGPGQIDGAPMQVYSFQTDDLLVGIMRPELIGGPVGSGQAWVDPATGYVRRVEVRLRVRPVQPFLFPSPTPGGPPASPLPGAVESLPETILFRYEAGRFDVPVTVPNPPGVLSPTYPPNP